MKEVKAPYDFMVPPAANLEDMTQPVGPLLEGDQALVDAAHKLPAGEHVAEKDGTYTRVSKYDELGRDQVVTHTTLPDGTVESASTLIDYVPGMEGISADISEWPAGERGGRTVAEASGNNVGGVIHPQEDREQAQAIKLEVAHEIDAATQRLIDGQVQDPVVAQKMAEVVAARKRYEAEASK